MKRWLSLLFLLLFTIGCEIEQQKRIIIKDIITNEPENNKHLLPFIIRTNTNMFS